MTAYPHIAARLFDTAHAIEPNAFRTILEGPLARRVLAGERIDASTAKKNKQSQLKASTSRLSAIVDCQPVTVAGGVAEFGLTDDGIAIIPVAGILSRRYDWLTALCGWTTYEGLTAAFDQMLADSRVKAILMDVESPGGEAAGMLDISDKIIASRSIKPIWAVANTFAASAAYGIAGSGERLLLPRRGQVGSIGAVRVHVDQSKFDEAGGEKYTAKYSGARKIDGWGHAPLSEGAAEVWQADVDNCRQQFADLVGRQGRMTSAQALKTEAGMAFDFDAVQGRFADAVATFDEAFAELSDLVADRPRSTSAAARAGQPGGGAQPMKTEPAATPETTTSNANPGPAPAAAANPAPPAAPAATEAPASAAAPAAPALAAAAPVAPAQPAAAAPGAYTAEMAAETMELCQLAGASIQDARAFVTAQTPIAAVRTQLAARQATAAAATGELNPTPPAKSATAGWDEAVAAVNKQNGFLKK